MRARNLLSSVLGLVLLLSGGQTLALGDDEYLQPEEAFQYTATADEQNVTVEWRATKGYYLYKKRLGLSPGTPGVTVGDSVYPKGEIHKDEYFGEQEVFRGTFTVTAPLSGAKAGDTVALKLKWQGCADAGLCYPPSVWDATVKVTATTAAAAPVVEGEEVRSPHHAIRVTLALAEIRLQLHRRSSFDIGEQPSLRRSRYTRVTAAALPRRAHRRA